MPFQRLRRVRPECGSRSTHRAGRWRSWAQSSQTSIDVTCASHSLLIAEIEGVCRIKRLAARKDRGRRLKARLQPCERLADERGSAATRDRPVRHHDVDRVPRKHAPERGARRGAPQEAEAPFHGARPTGSMIPSRRARVVFHPCHPGVLRRTLIEKFSIRSANSAVRDARWRKRSHP